MDHSKNYELKTTHDLILEALQTIKKPVVDLSSEMLEAKDSLHPSYEGFMREKEALLKTKTDGMDDDLVKLNQELVVKERQAHAELEEARKELIKYLARREHVIRVSDEQVLNANSKEDCRGSDLKLNKELMTEVGKLKTKVKEYKVLVIFIVSAVLCIMFIPKNW